MNYDNRILGALVFLNSLNIGLYYKDDITNNDIIELYDKNKENVGGLFIKDNIVHVYAIYLGNQIHASYDLNNVLRGIYDITFNIAGDIGKLCGKYLIKLSLDQRKVIFKIQLSLFEDNSKVVAFSLENNGIFNLVLTKDDKYNEFICMPFDDKNGYIIHRTYEEDKNMSKKKYDRYCSVTLMNNDNLKKYLGFNGMMENDLITSQKSEFYNIREGYDNHLIDIGNIMNKIDPSTRKMLDKVRTILNFDNYELFDNLMATCFANYCSEEAFIALFGYKKPHMVFQDGSKSLEELFFNKKRLLLMKKKEKE